MKLFGKRNEVIGVATEDIDKARECIRQMYEEAHARQKSHDAVPTGFMRGLAAALDVLDCIQPRAL